MSAYGSSTVNRRRRSRAELAELDAAIVAAVEADHPVSLRGVYYRVVSAGAVEKTEKGYRVVGRQLLKLRRSTVIPYSRITDGTRYVLHRPSWADTGAALDALAASYRKMLWLDQPVTVQLFTEKDAICGVVEPVANRWDVPLGVVRGYSSETFAYEMAAQLPRGRLTVIYQLGDYDPSGVNAWEVFCRRVEAFAPDAHVIFERLAVTPEQIYVLDLPTRPTKATDSRAKGFTGESVEVDAIPAPKLRELVEDAITRHVDPTVLRITQEVEAQERAGLEVLGWKCWAGSARRWVAPVTDYAPLGVRLPGDPPGLVLPLAEVRAQVADRLIRENGLGDRRQGGDGDPGDDGGEQQTAVDRRYLELRSRLLDAAGLLTIPAPMPIVDGLLFRDSLAWLTGKPGHGKSLAAVDLACCVGTGTDWHGRRVTRGKVMYLIAEGASGLGLRVEAWSLRAGRPAEQVLFLPVPDH